MRLIGSLTEDQMREELIASNAALQTNSERSRLRAALRSCGADPATAYVLGWIPEQDADIFTVITANERVIEIELARSIQGPEPIIEIQPLRDFQSARRRGSRIAQIRLAVALDLLRHHSSIRQ